MAYRMPKVCTARHGASKIPDRGPGGGRPSNPRSRPIQPLTRNSLSRPRGRAGRALTLPPRSSWTAMGNASTMNVQGKMQPTRGSSILTGACSANCSARCWRA